MGVETIKEYYPCIEFRRCVERENAHPHGRVFIVIEQRHFSPWLHNQDVWVAIRPRREIAAPLRRWLSSDVPVSYEFRCRMSAWMADFFGFWGPEHGAILPGLGGEVL